MMKKTYYTILIIFVILIILLPSFCYGKEDLTTITDFDSYKGGGGNSSQLKPIVDNIAGIVMAVGSAVSIIALIIIGIRYMIGSVEEKAEYKKTLIPYVIGAILIFAMSTIPTIIYKAASNF